MSPPNKISSGLTRYYDEANGICHPPEPAAGLKAQSPEHFRIPGARLSVLAATGSHAVVSSLWRANPMVFNPVLGAVACTFDTSPMGSATGSNGKSIEGIHPVTEETDLNMDPITGKIRQVALDISPEAKGVMAWSVSDFDNEAVHGVFALSSEDNTMTRMQRIAPAVGNIPRDTSAAVLSNGESVVLFAQIQGDAAPSSLMAQRLSATGDPVGDLMAILPETVRTGFPQGQVIAAGDGFVVVFRDGEGKLGMASYDLNGVEQERQEIGDEPLAFQVAAGEDGQWALATLAANEVQVRRFDGSSPTGVDTTIDTLAIANSSDLSLAMQGDGSIMVAWNALEDDGDALLEGAFLSPDGSQVGENQILRNLVQGSGYDHQDHINSHSITTDHQGNFILAYEENRSIFANVFKGTMRGDNWLTDVASTSALDAGVYGDLLAGLDGLLVQNVDVNIAASQDGLLSFVFTKIYSGVDSATGETKTVNKIVRRDYQISYE